MGNPLVFLSHVLYMQWFPSHLYISELEPIKWIEEPFNLDSLLTGDYLEKTVKDFSIIVNALRPLLKACYDVAGFQPFERFGC